MIPRREVAKHAVRVLLEAHPDEVKPGLVFVLLVHEVPVTDPNRPPGADADSTLVGLELDASLACPQAANDVSSLLLLEFGRRIKEAVTTIASELAEDLQVAAVRRVDLELARQQPGPRPKA